MIYWSETRDEEAAKSADDVLAAILSGSASATAAGDTAHLRDALRSLARGMTARGIAPDTPYCILTIEPGVGRHAVRDWTKGAMGELARHVVAHQKALAIAPMNDDLSIRQIVDGMRRQKKGRIDPKHAISPSITRELMRAVTSGGAYPLSLVHGVLGRLRVVSSDQGPGATRFRTSDPIARARVALLKAWLIRNHKEGDIYLALNPDHPSSAYQLGRLLAAVENLQIAAMPKINVTAADRHYRTMSMRPGVSLPSLMASVQVYGQTLQRAGKGWGISLERDINQIMARIDGIPTTMPLSDQGLFALGFYQQRADYDSKRQARRSVDPARPSELVAEQR